MFLLIGRLDIRDLQLLQECGGTCVRILDSVAPDWEEIAVAIGLGITDINRIAREHSSDVGRACLQVFGHWLSDYESLGLPLPTWRALLEVLLRAEFNSLADQIQTLLGTLIT